LEIYRSALTETDLFGTATVVCTAGQFTRVGEYKVTAGELLAMGYGEENGGYAVAIGRIYMLLQTAVPAESLGTVRLTAMTSFDRPSEILFECPNSVIDNNPTDRTKQLPLPVHDLFLSQDKRLELSFNPYVTATITLADSTINLDVTRAAV